MTPAVVGSVMTVEDLQRVFELLQGPPPPRLNKLEVDMKRWGMCYCGHREVVHREGEGCTFVIPAGAIGHGGSPGEHRCTCSEGRYPREVDE